MTPERLGEIRRDFAILASTKLAVEIFAWIRREHPQSADKLKKYLPSLQKQIRESRAFPGFDSAMTALLIDEYEESVDKFFSLLATRLEDGRLNG